VDKNLERLPPNYRHNFAAFLTDYIFFGIAFNFFNPNSVLPAFVGELTDSAPVIGLVSAIFSGGWLLPQLLAASVINDKPRKKPYLLAGISGRVMLWMIALALGLGLSRYPAAMLAVFFVCLALWAISDGIGSVAWFDIMAQAIPAKRRGRLISTSQFVSGLAGIGAGAVISLVLAQWTFPRNYTLIFVLAGALLIPSTVALFTIREVPRKGTGSQEDGKKSGGARQLYVWSRQMLADPAFRRLMICRLLVGTLGLATSFYVQHARVALQLPQSIIGAFVIAQTIAGVVASLVLGLVCERWGSQHAARLGSAAALTGPLFALLAHLAGGGWLVQAYPVVYVSLGIINSTWMLGFFNYLLEIAPDDMRSAYVGVGNTVMGVLTLAPIVGGWLLETTSYAVLFGLTTVLVTAGFLLTLGLKPPQHVRSFEELSP
jgi:MFS family permease